MHLSRWRNRKKIEDLVREARPAPSRKLEDTLSQMVGRNPAPRAGLRRSVVAVSFTVLVLAGLAAGGGIGYAAHLVAEPVVAVKVHVLRIQSAQPPSVRRFSAAISQYGGGGGGGTTTTTTTTTPPPPPPPTTPPGFQLSKGVTVTANADGTFTATCISVSDCIVTYVGPGLVTVNFAGDNAGATVHLRTLGSAIVLGAGPDNVTVVDYRTTKGGTRNSPERNNVSACVQALNAGAGNNNIHVVGPCAHTVIVGAGNSAIRVYGGTNTINAIGPGHQNIHATGGKGTIRVGKGGSTVFTTGASKYTINVANGSKDVVNCAGAKDVVTYDKGVDRLIHCGAATKKPKK